MTNSDTMERDPYLTVVSMDAKSAKLFYTNLTGGVPGVVHDAGPARPDRYRDGARVFHVYPREWSK